MRECWINVYLINGKHKHGAAFKSKWAAELAVRGSSILYRIHVKMKPIYIQH